MPPSSALSYTEAQMEWKEIAFPFPSLLKLSALATGFGEEKCEWQPQRVPYQTRLAIKLNPLFTLEHMR